MMIRSLKRRVASDAGWLRFTQALCGIAACLMLLMGFRELPKLDLTEAQMLLGIGVICSLWLQCGILYVLIDAQRRNGSR